jgi:hypothetical protein
MNDYTVFIPVTVTAENKADAGQYALDDIRDPSLLNVDWNVYVADGWLCLSQLDMAGMLERITTTGDK